MIVRPFAALALTAAVATPIFALARVPVPVGAPTPVWSDVPSSITLPSNEQPVQIALRILRREPVAGTSVEHARPEISATFAEPVDPKSLRLAIDGRDVTPDAFLSRRAFVYTPNFDLPLGAHSVAVSGRTPDREEFAERWTFDTRAASAVENYINGIEPPNGSSAGSGLTVSGITRPLAHVRLVLATSETIANFSDVANGANTIDTAADGSGYFEAHVDVPKHASIVDIRIASAAPDGSVAVRTLRLLP